MKTIQLSQGYSAIVAALWIGAAIGVIVSNVVWLVILRVMKP